MTDYMLSSKKCQPTVTVYQQQENIFYHTILFCYTKRITNFCAALYYTLL